MQSQIIIGDFRDFFVGLQEMGKYLKISIDNMQVK